MFKKIFLFYLILFLFFSCKNKNNDKEMANQLNVKIISDIKEFGKINFKKNIIIYKTETIIKKYSDNSTDTIVRFYVRDFEGKFNIKIFEVLNTPDFNGATYGELLEKKYLKINRSAPGHATTIIKLDGSFIKKKINDEYGIIKLISPNNRYLVISTYYDLPEKSEYIPNTVVIKNLKNKKTDEYDFSQASLNGIYLGGFSNDSKYIYICGGRYEFWAEAKLWKIDIENKNIYKYEGIDKLSYPVNLFINDNIAYISNQKYQFIEEYPTKIDLFELNLNNKELKLLTSENAISAFHDLIKINDLLFYRIGLEDQKYQFIQMNLKDKNKTVLYNELIFVIDYSIKDRWILIQTYKNFKIIYPFDNKEIILGESSKIGYSTPDDKREYINSIVGIVEH